MDPEIKPRIDERGEPLCSGKDCPSFELGGYCKHINEAGDFHSIHRCCIPALRNRIEKLRDALACIALSMNDNTASAHVILKAEGLRAHRVLEETKK